MKNNLILNPKIAELCGIIVGDGYLGRYISPKRSNYHIEFACNYTEEIDYISYIQNLFYFCFNKTLKVKINDDYTKLYLNSKEILNYLENIGMIVGKKSQIAKIPKIILKNMDFSLYFLRGLIDTDDSICFKKGNKNTNSYPHIVLELASKKLITEVCIILNKLSISFCYYPRISKSSFGEFVHYRIEINGKNNFYRWISLIGFSNPKHLTKIKVWKLLGYCPPNSTYQQRLRIIKEEETKRFLASNPPGRLPCGTS